MPDNEYEYDPKAVEKVLKKGAGFEVLRRLKPIFARINWSAGEIKQAFEDFCSAGGLGMGKVAQPVRVAVTGTTISPPIYDTLEILGDCL